MQNTFLTMSLTRRMIPGLIGLSFFVTAFDRMTFGQAGVPRPVEVFTEEKLGRKPLNSYGSLEGSIQTMRAYRPLDLNAEAWRKANPGRSHQEWAREARESLRRGLHYDLPPVDLKARTLARVESDDFIRETIEFNTTPWFRVPGYFYIPKNV